VAKAGDEGRRFPMSMRDAGAQLLALRGAPALARVESRYLVERNEYESVGLFRPELADELVGCEAFERLQAAGAVVCGDEVGKMRVQFGVRFVKVAFDGRLFDTGSFVRPDHWFRDAWVWSVDDRYRRGRRRIRKHVRETACPRRAFV